VVALDGRAETLEGVLAPAFADLHLMQAEVIDGRSEILVLADGTVEVRQVRLSQMLHHLSEHDRRGWVYRESVFEERVGLRHAASQAAVHRYPRPQVTAGEPFLQRLPNAALLVGDQVYVAGLALAILTATGRPTTHGLNDHMADLPQTYQSSCIGGFRRFYRLGFQFRANPLSRSVDALAVVISSKG
jgi:hypothetical protein